MAVAEAVQNSMDAIHESGNPGRILIEIERAKDLAASGSAETPVRTVTVRDTGIGFNDANYRSFCTPDSLKKQKTGGKGLGRLTCLQAFERLRVRSVYREANESFERRLILQCDSPELAGSTQKLVVPARIGTELRLENLRTGYESTAALDFNEVAEWLAEHFLPALVERPKWLQSLILKDGNEEVDLTRVIEGGATWVEEFEINTYPFRAVCYSVSTDAGADMVRLVAGSRIVHANTRPLEFYLSHLSNVAEQEAHVVLIYSPFFDEHVNDARNGVSFAEEGDGVLLGITAPEFREACSTALKKNLGKRLDAAREDFKARITAVVTKEAPYYRPLLLSFFSSKEFTNLSTSSKDEDILSALDTFKRRDALKLKQESRRLARLKSEGDGYWESAQKLAGQIEVQKKVALAEYVSLRKIVLERLGELLEVTGDGKAHREAAIHNLIFPQRSDSESTPGIDHQLWIVDERLESHIYLASDQPLDAGDGDRPDLLIALDHPGAFASEPAQKAAGYERIVLVEFKRALDDFATIATDKLPHQQMMRYARQILNEKAVHIASGRPVKAANNARFYMYAVCEMSAAFLQRLVETGFTPSPTGDGAFWVTNQGKYYVEYISLPKLLEDAQARNLAFFRKLGLEG